MHCIKYNLVSVKHFIPHISKSKKPNILHFSFFVNVGHILTIFKTFINVFPQIFPYLIHEKKIQYHVFENVIQF